MSASCHHNSSVADKSFKGWLQLTSNWLGPYANLSTCCWEQSFFVIRY